ncbi:MAG: hypothetical protein ABFS46_18140 [Myxococcota bacterium]
MPLIKETVTLAANETANPLQGSQYEYLPWAAAVQFAILADAGDVIRASVFSGSDVLQQESQIDTKPVADAIQFPWDYNLEDVAMAGERLGVTVTDASGLGGVVRVAVRITPL